MRARQCIVTIMLLSATIGCAHGNTPPVGRVEGSLEDGRISASVRTALLNDPELGLRSIAVETRMGVVTLSGSVRTADEAQRAERLTRAVDGVREVRSELKIAPKSWLASVNACPAADVS